MRLTRTISTIVVLATLGTLAPATFAGNPQDSNFSESIYVSGTGLSDATGMAWATDGSDTLFVSQKGDSNGGHLRVIRNGVLQAMDFATVSPIHLNSECGLDNVVVDPSYSSNRYVYVFATVSASVQRIFRFTATVSGSNLIGMSQTQIGPDLPTVGNNHDGGGMAIGPDGYLYWGVGNLGNGTGQSGSAGEFSTYASKICRMDRFTGNAVPGGPYGSATTVRTYMYAKGFRNPFGLRFHPTTGALWLTEVGDSWEQIFLVTSGSDQGYGVIGENNSSTTNGYLIPKYAYPTVLPSGTRGCLTRGIFYNGTQFPLSYRGDFYFCEHIRGQLMRGHVSGDTITSADLFVDSVPNIVDVSVGPDGALYYVTRGTSNVYRLAYSGPTQNLVVSPTTLTFAEGSSGVFNVRLAVQPSSSVTVNIARTAGDVNLTAAPTSLTFTTGNWNVNQPVTVSSVATPNGANETATFTVSSAGLVPQTVQVTATDTGVANAPTASLSAPANGQIIVGSFVDFYGGGTAASGSALTKAEFYIDGVLKYTDPYDSVAGHFHFGGAHTAWDSTLTPDGPHTLRMTVYDNFSPPRSGSASVNVYIANNTAVYQQSSASDGVVIVEGALFSNSAAGSDGHTWVLDTSFPGYSGAGAMRAMPDSGTNNTGPGGYTSLSPRLDYVVNFTKTGTHYVWVRGIGPSGLGNDDSCHVGLDGAVVAAAERITNFGTAWTWANMTMNPSVATINVASTGPHVVNVWMREDGFAIDKLLLTINSAYPAPSGAGPGASSNIGGGTGGPPVTGGGGGGGGSGGGGCGATGFEALLAVLAFLVGKRIRR